MERAPKRHPEAMEQAPKHHPEVEHGLEDLSFGIKRPFQVSDMISQKKLLTINEVDYILKSNFLIASCIIVIFLLKLIFRKYSGNLNSGNILIADF